MHLEWENGTHAHTGGLEMIERRRRLFAQRLRAIRRQVGVSRYRLAQAAGLSKQAVYRLENGECDPTWDTVQRLSEVLGVSTERFKTGVIIIARLAEQQVNPEASGDPVQRLSEVLGVSTEPTTPDAEQQLKPRKKGK
jgi:transcriptional regulator with XRE-family HTH domain